MDFRLWNKNTLCIMLHKNFDPVYSISMWWSCYSCIHNRLELIPFITSEKNNGEFLTSTNPAIYGPPMVMVIPHLYYLFTLTISWGCEKPDKVYTLSVASIQYNCVYCLVCIAYMAVMYFSSKEFVFFFKRLLTFGTHRSSLLVHKSYLCSH